MYEGASINSGEAISLFYVDHYLPNYYEVLATINADKDKAGLKSNAYIIFDYFSETDFKFAGIDVGIDKLQIGQRTADGWVVETQKNMQLKSSRNYNILVAVHGTIVTLMVDGTKLLSYTFEPRVIDGFSYGLNYGMVGISANNAVSRFDNVAVQKLAPEIVFEHTEDFSDHTADLFTPQNGIWGFYDGHYRSFVLESFGQRDIYGAITTMSPENITVSSYLEFEVTISTSTSGGLVFDYYSSTDFKFVAILPDTDQVVIGHRTAKGWYYDAVIAQSIDARADYNLAISLCGTSVSLSLDGQVVLGYSFNSLLTDGNLGLFNGKGAGYFDDVLTRVHA
jgi:hypothetical protein